MVGSFKNSDLTKIKRIYHGTDYFYVGTQTKLHYMGIPLTVFELFMLSRNEPKH